MLRRLARGLPKRLKAWWLERTLSTYRPTKRQKLSNLSAELIVSLTSYPLRFPHLHLTLHSLLRQTVKPDRLILWIAHDDADHLPAKVKALSQYGLDIRLCPNVGSYKKIIFALEQFPHSFIATADDDTYYRRDWLELLVRGHEPGVITCHRAHRIPVSNGSIPSYASWQWDVQDEAARKPSMNLMPTGIGGVLYPPGSLHPGVTDCASFLDLCRDADDVWLYWMARRAGSTYKKVGGRFQLHYWPGTQQVRLYNDNVTDNNRQIARMNARYGSPFFPHS